MKLYAAAQTEEWDWVRSDRTAAAEGADLYKALLDAAPDALVVVDASGVIRIINRQAETLFGYGRDELLGRSVDILVPDAVRAFHAGRREQYAQSKHEFIQNVLAEAATRVGTVTP